MMSYLNNGYDVMNYFAKFEKLLPHSIIIPSFMTIGSQMPDLDGGGGGKQSKLQTLQNRAARIITNATSDNTDHTETIELVERVSTH